MSWSWEYSPSEDHVAAGAPPALLVHVEEKAAELLQAAEALHVHGTAYEGLSPQGGVAFVEGGTFDYQVLPGHERVHIFQVTAW
ncbi:hypothetical protein [Streptomyces chrestomyceticus]|uniref:hypothetical protein n=1 Tax=Streptomyces chrestomyceticus TaxID=68185 RepID=UPI00340C6F96